MRYLGIMAFGISLLGMSVVSEAADVLFTVSATSNAAQLGYTSGQEVTFQFLMDGDFASDDSDFLEDLNSWAADTPPVPLLYKSVTGTGLTGSYVPTTNPYAFVLNDSSGLLEILAGTEASATSIGLSTPDGTSVRIIDIAIYGAANWTFPGTYTSPQDYFQSFVGSLNVGSGDAFLIQAVGSGTQYEFTITSASIDVIPEPSTWALLSLGGVVVFFAMRRRKRVAR